MIRVYYLHVVSVDGTEQVSGIEFIHDALLECGEDTAVRVLTQDTTPDEHAHLIAAALFWQEATQDEIDRYHNQVVITTPDPDTIRAEELLATSPSVITQPELWELMRIFGRRLGYHA